MQHLPSATNRRWGTWRRETPLNEPDEGSQRLDLGILQGSAERVTVDLVMVRKHDQSAIKVLQLYMAALAVSFHQAEPFERSENLAPREQWQLHMASLTTSCFGFHLAP
jgi:hypothetical protein